MVYLQEADEISLVLRVPACMCMSMRLPDQYVSRMLHVSISNLRNERAIKLSVCMHFYHSYASRTSATKQVGHNRQMDFPSQMYDVGRMKAGCNSVHIEWLPQWRWPEGKTTSLDKKKN